MRKTFLTIDKTGIIKAKKQILVPCIDNKTSEFIISFLQNHIYQDERILKDCQKDNDKKHIKIFSERIGKYKNAIKIIKNLAEGE